MEPQQLGVSAQFLLTLGGILLAGLLLSAVAKRSFLPRVTLLLIFGAVIGEQALDLIPALFTDRFELIADMTLLMVGFLLGGKLTAATLGEHSVKSFTVSLAAALLPAVLVCAAMLALGLPLEIALLLGCFAAATDPAAVFDVVEESGVRSKFSELLTLIVVLDDVWGLLLFGVGIAIVVALNGQAADHGTLGLVLQELGGGVLLGAAIGLPASYLSGRVKEGKPVLAEALGIVFLCGGLALWLQVSYLIAAIVMGAVVANLARHHEYPFHAIEGIESLFMVVFFVLAGASLQFDALAVVGVTGLAYILCRAFAKQIGAWAGGLLGGVPQSSRRLMGLTLMPQGGLAIGMALVASNRFPEYRQVMLPIVIASTVVFELVGPVFTRYAIRHAPQNND